jgi:hypothetical protein
MALSESVIDVCLPACVMRESRDMVFKSGKHRSSLSWAEPEAVYLRPLSE